MNRGGGAAFGQGRERVVAAVEARKAEGGGGSGGQEKKERKWLWGGQVVYLEKTHVAPTLLLVHHDGQAVGRLVRTDDGDRLDRR